MSERAKDFVEYWIAEFLHPDMYEDEESFCESRQNALACLKSAAAYGIAKPEIDEEVGDLVAHIARAHVQIVDAQMRRVRHRA